MTLGSGLNPTQFAMGCFCQKAEVPDFVINWPCDCGMLQMTVNMSQLPSIKMQSCDVPVCVCVCVLAIRTLEPVRKKLFLNKILIFKYIKKNLLEWPVVTSI